MAALTDAATETPVAAPYRVDGQSEIVGGEPQRTSSSGCLHGRAPLSVAICLRDYENSTRSGRAISDNTGLLVDLPRRNSSSPDAAFYTGPVTGRKFLPGGPDFAVEVRGEGVRGEGVRGEGVRGAAAEREMVAKRAYYFAAGTRVAWEVDLLSEDDVRVYGADNPSEPTIYHEGDHAEAKPAIPGWSMPVNDLFE